ncbi:ribonuclease R [Candidatus Kaiserbacteria bacterium]|nr:ribonuclease R [Candidatus Kaiserbacteria bacterium]MCB9811756.1 ribonuclease R [Candidatus Nomurabacteria bacterium]
MSSQTYTGTISINSRGLGFVSLPDREEDVIIQAEERSFALSGDVVEITLKQKQPGKRQEGAVVRVLEPAHSEFIGVIKKNEANTDCPYYFQPDNHRVHIRPLLPEVTAADEGMKVVARIKSWKSPHTEPIGEVVEVLGKAGDHETEMQAIIRSGGFSQNFPAVVSKAAHDLYERKEEIFAAALEDPKRRDMRNVPTMTIDPVDAKDFDDALSFRTLENGQVEIGIHIADVSHYVTDGDHIDLEARERGTSIYLVDRVIPMLPEVLSNDLCSLRPNEDRLAFSAVFKLDSEAGVVDEWYGQTIIHSDKRFSYEEAQTVLDTNDGPFLSELTEMMRLARLIRQRRHKHGAIAFEQPEVKFELDEKGVPVRAFTKTRTETMLMIEDYMLLANQHVATYIHKLCKDKGKDAAFVYRVHDTPDPEKIDELSIFLHALGYELKNHKGVVKATDINRLLKEIEGTPEETLIKTATIRSMAKAVYTTKNIGHYGLAFKFYTHFTSPIRRYPDLMAHRLLRRHLDGSNISGKEMAKFEKLSVQSSEREIDAVRAERDSIKYKQVEYMLPKVGQTFTGVISGVTDWGVYVEEKESKAEGLVRLASIKGDFFEHKASQYEVKGQKKGKSYRLGDEVKMKLVRADLEEKRLDFELV